jgi:hypothetical protein
VSKGEDYVSDFVRTLDKLCRLLFLFYSHPDQFEDRYGKENLPALEDSLRDNIKQLGDLLVYIHEKDISDSDIPDDTGDNLTQGMI